MMSHTRKVTREVELGDIYESKRLQQRTLTESKEAVVDYQMGQNFEKIADFKPIREKNKLPV